MSKYGKEQAQDLIKKSLKVVPVNFSQEYKQMLMHTKKILEKGFLVVNLKFDKRITSLRTALWQWRGVGQGEYVIWRYFECSEIIDEKRRI